MDAEDIEAIPIFAGLTPDQLPRVTEVSRSVHFEVGHEGVREGVREGEYAFGFYAIRQGAEASRGTRPR